MNWKAIAKNKKIKIALLIATIFSLIGSILYYYAVRSDAYLEAERFLTYSNQIKEHVGELVDYSLDSVGIRVSDGLRVYYRYTVVAKDGNASVTVWLTKDNEENAWEVIHYRIYVDNEG